MKKLILMAILAFIFTGNCFAATGNTIGDRHQKVPVPSCYNQTLVLRETHKFDDNQIRSFVYYWYGLHDYHADIQKSLELLDKKHLLMTFPEITVRNFMDYKKWYDGVGKNIKSNIHMVKKLNVIFLPNHQYQVNVVVNWQAIDKDNKFINADVTQQWKLVDGDSDSHPYVQEYKILNFKSEGE